MNPILANIIVIVLLVFAVAFAGISIFRKKKNGKSCAGCPMADSCPHDSFKRGVEKDRENCYDINKGERESECSTRSSAHWH